MKFKKVRLSYFSRDEQLAYWLNLYNVTVLNEIIAVYPKNNLKKLVTGKKSIFARKLLTVAGVPLSLDDIQFTILRQNYDNNPLIIYGLYKGIIGGPNIRKESYSGATVYRALEYNATEFINSNRGTNRDNGRYKVQKVSSLYARNSAYFPDFDADLSAHLLKYIEGQGRKKSLSKARVTLKPTINDWTVTDFWGTFPEVRNGLAHNPAAMMNAIVSTSPGDPATSGGAMGASISGATSSAYLSKAGQPFTKNYRHDMFQYLLVINMKRVRTNEKNATVTMEELGEFPVHPDADQKDKDN